MGAKIFYEDEEWKIIHNRDYVLIRKNKPYEFHSHFRTVQGAYLLLELFNLGYMPNKPYFVQAMLRVCTDEEFIRLKEEPKKQKYRNCRTRYKRR
jgi:hypothetical protein